MSDKEFAEYMKQQKIITPEGKVLTAADAITLQSEIAATGTGIGVMAGGLLLVGGIAAIATGVGTPVGIGMLATLGAAAGAGGYYAEQHAHQEGYGRGLDEGSVGYQIVPTEDAMVTPQTMGKNYVHPVFNKEDKFYAAKEGGAIAMALDEVLHAVDKLIEEKQDVNLNISERKLAQAVDSAFVTLSARRV